MFDSVIVGAGLTGSVFARELAEMGRRVLVVEKKGHIGGRCYDRYDEHGILIHEYGPHLFHTSNSEVYAYLSRFTEWREYQHRVLADVDGTLIPLPFNLDSLHALFPRQMAMKFEHALLESFGFGEKVPILKLRQSGSSELQWLADFIYEKIFLNYTLKQWGGRPEDINPEVTGRVPIFISRDNRYFQERYQAVPRYGYTKMFENLLAHSGIHLLLQTTFQDILAVSPETGEIHLFGRSYSGELVFTGMIDELFGFRFGKLPYRSLDFRFSHYTAATFQPAAVVNYPNGYNFTRITEFKQITGQDAAGTTVLREFPLDYEYGAGIGPCYPMTDENSVRMYRQYRELAKSIPGLIPVGRLAEYRYYDMDDVVARVLSLTEDLASAADDRISRD